MNLLPAKERQIMEREYYKRFIVAVLVLMTVLIPVGLIPLTVTSVVSAYEIADLRKQIEGTSKENDMGGVNANIAIIKDVNNKLDILTRSLPEDLGYDVSTLFSSIVTSAKVKLNSVSYQKIATKKGKTKDVGYQIVVGGIANTRSSLQNFVKVLQADVRFSSVDLPISNLVESKDISFEITITVNKK